MGVDSLQEHIYYKKKNYRLKHNAGDESMVSCCIYHMFVLKVSDQTTLVIRNSSIPQSVDLAMSSFIVFYSSRSCPKLLLETISIFLKLFTTS
jgi:hypothetical protein